MIDYLSKISAAILTGVKRFKIHMLYACLLQVITTNICK